MPLGLMIRERDAQKVEVNGFSFLYVWCLENRNDLSLQFQAAGADELCPFRVWILRILRPKNKIIKEREKKTQKRKKNSEILTF